MEFQKILAENNINILSEFLTVQPLRDYSWILFFIDYTDIEDENKLSQIIEQTKTVSGFLRADLKISDVLGVIFDEISFPVMIRGERTIPIDAKRFTLTFKRLYDLFDDTAAVMIHEIGKAYGEDLAKWFLSEFSEFQFSKKANRRTYC